MPVSLKEEIFVRRLKKIAQGWGGDVVAVDKTHFLSELPLIGGWSKAPFEEGIGIMWEEKTVYYCKELVQRVVTSVIHEMGHVFASEVMPDEADEMNFFGWEYALSKQIKLHRLAWMNWNRDYNVTEVYSIGDILKGPNRVRRYPVDREEFPRLAPILKECLRIGHEKGLLIDNIPQAIR